MAEGTKLDVVYRYHQPNDEQVVRYNRIRAAGREFAKEVLLRTLPSREQSLALTKIEEAVMWANAGIARNEE